MAFVAINTLSGETNGRILSTVILIRLLSLSTSLRSCLGLSFVLSGQKRSPEPPAIIRTVIFIIIYKWLVPVMLRLERPLCRNSYICCLLRSENSKFHSKLLQVKTSNLLIKMFRKHIDTKLIFFRP